MIKNSVSAIIRTGAAFGELLVTVFTLLIINIIVLAPAAWVVTNIVI